MKHYGICVSTDAGIMGVTLNVSVDGHAATLLAHKLGSTEELTSTTI